MVKVKNANIGKEENYEEGRSSIGGRIGKGKGKRVAIEVRVLERKRRKIAPGLRVDLSDMEVGDHIVVGKIYNKHTFKRMGFSRNEEGMLIRGGQDDNDKSDDDDEGNEGQEATNVDDEESEEGPEEETFRRKMRQKKRQERVDESQASGSMSQLMDMIASIQAFMNSRFNALDG
ncbi:hypothetical protein M9H77_16232 [Catharanthus roseus]|uniref:Uncharacterized protein n=1 Tax=Catharanthus roseus TaxID=4058 RepID=A0ACC0B0E7_CATRO|nr:hypothetical protein M9H77_16232 [Catharanthus roseus]